MVTPQGAGDDAGRDEAARGATLELWRTWHPEPGLVAVEFIDHAYCEEEARHLAKCHGRGAYHLTTKEGETLLSFIVAAEPTAWRLAEIG